MSNLDESAANKEEVSSMVQHQEDEFVNVEDSIGSKMDWFQLSRQKMTLRAGKSDYRFMRLMLHMKVQIDSRASFIDILNAFYN